MFRCKAKGRVIVGAVSRTSTGDAATDSARRTAVRRDAVGNMMMISGELIGGWVMMRVVNW